MANIVDSPPEPSALFELSLLPPALCQFAVVADTHYMLDPGDAPLEFESRRLQSRRAAAALRQVAALRPDFVVHLGDLVQEYPGTPHFEPALDQALEQIRVCGLGQVYQVAGNHDVGDKPDPTMPTHPVCSDSLAAYHARFGRSWYSFDRGDLHFVVLNSQIMNTPLPAAARQREWLEADLAAHSGGRIFVFTHLPPYLSRPDEPALGHYDNLDEPDRAWLLALLRRYRAEYLFAAHVHFEFCDLPGPTRYRIAPSTSFTRPGFGHLFTGPPPPERGRDDRPKLGFLLCRVLEDRTEVIRVRTGGALEPPAGPPVLLAPRPAATESILGLTLTHPLSSTAEVPLAWPSAIRQPVRNDYPLLACLELGAGVLRLPWTDLEDPQQHPRLALLRREGLALRPTVLWSPQLPFEHLLRRCEENADELEVQLPGALYPTDSTGFPTRQKTLRLALCPVLPGEVIDGKQHPRTRLGYRPGELAGLDRALRQQNLRASALCRLEDRPWERVTELHRLPPLETVDRLDLLLELPGTDDALNAALAAEALFAAALLSGSRLFVEPLLDLDRTMDLRAGLLDPLCNPRPVFQALATLRPALQPLPTRGLEADQQHSADLRLLRLSGPELRLELALPLTGEAVFPAPASQPASRVYYLLGGRCACPPPDDLAGRPLREPVLLVYASS